MADQHPLILELNSLRFAVDQYQHAVYLSSIQLQHARLEASEASEQAKALEAENNRLKHEISILRVHVEPSQTTKQVTELSLALRRASDNVSLLEDALFKRTRELTDTVSEKHKAQTDSRLKAVLLRELQKAQSDTRAREAELERRCKAAEEEARMADLVVIEYANLVRSLESKGTHNEPALATNGYMNVNEEDLPTLTSELQNAMPLQSLTENRTALQRLLHEFNNESSNLQAEISRLHGELMDTQTALESERNASALDRQRLAETLTQLKCHEVDDTVASKIVSRYMQFSQFSLNSLQTTLSNVKSRYAASLATLTASSEAMALRLDLERKRAFQLRTALDQITEDILRESFGRRREVALKLRYLHREEKILDKLQDWLRRAEQYRIDLRSNVSVSLSLQLINGLIDDAHTVVLTLNTEEQPSSETSWARVAVAEQTCASLASELQKQTEEKLELIKNLAKSFEDISLDNKEIQVPDNDGPSSADVPKKNEVIPNLGIISENGGHKSATIVVGDQAAVPPESHHCTESNLSNEMKSLSVPSGSVLDDEIEEGKLGLIHASYGSLQESFHDCHITLSHLKERVSSKFSNEQCISLIQAAILRLDDFCEDARVELEIRVADEERMAHDFETITKLGASSTVNEHKCHQEFRGFVDRTLPSVVKAQETFTTKLEDLEHDIAQVKRILDQEGLESETSNNIHTSTPGWTKPFSPFHTQFSAPTFGTVITSHRPRILNSTASTSLNIQEIGDPYARFGLRLPMPHSIHPEDSSPFWLPSPVKPKAGSSSIYALGLAASVSRSHFAGKVKESMENHDQVDVE